MAAVPPSLSVVIPIYNEPHWIGTVVRDLVAAVQRAPFAPAELVIVDDGSDEQTQAVLAELEAPFPLRVLRQDNAGRFAARRCGIEAATGDLVLLLDSRVSIQADALAFVASEFDRTGPLPIWNGHVNLELRGNPFGRMWWILESVAWAEYRANPRTTSYGVVDFDHYPKGTSCFLAPRELLLDAAIRFESQFADLRDANDDTPMIRSLAEHQRINISPGFSCLYRPRRSLGAFIHHAYHRGSTFIDGFGHPGTRFFGVILAFYPVSLTAGMVAVAKPRLAAKAAMLAPAAGAGVGLALRRPRADTRALALVGPIWLAAYGAGMWRGLWLVLSALKRHRDAPARQR
jgi:glycosyltransferase involved in cell wall biosynthesis